ncbi:hypothetical protein ABZ070_35450 [Streptomyces sp. NPDC006283]|uniref:hypothetical protein n=1 Tax=Streptomyces sp. NPDC006283 TaxID=3156741 RepID=UPI0033A0410D
MNDANRAAIVDMLNNGATADEIRARARAQGMAVSQVGSISKDVMDAWNNRDGKAAVPAQRRAGKLMAALPADADGGQPLTGTGRVTLLGTGGGAGFGAYAFLTPGETTLDQQNQTITFG